MNGSHEMLRYSLLIATLALTACQSKADKASTDPAVAVQTGPTLAALALAYPATSESKSDKRIEEAQRLVRTQPRQVEGYLGLARAFISKKRETGDAILLAYAGEALSAAESLDPRSAPALALRGVLLQEEHKFRQLASLAEALIKTDPSDTTGYLLLGDARLELGDYEGAAAAYDDAMERYPDLRVYSRGAHLRWLYGDVEGALEMMDAALDSAGRNHEHLAWCLTDVGQLFLRRGEIERAHAAANRAEALVAGYPPALALRARAHHGAGEMDEAAAAIRAALAVRASAADFFLLAEIEESRGATEAAKRAANAGLELADHDPVPAATFLARRGEQVERALALAARELAERPTIAAYAASALAHHRAGKSDQASQAIEQALKLGTPLAELHLGAGLIKLARGDAAGARSALAQATQLNPKADTRLASELRTKLEELR